MSVDVLSGVFLSPAEAADELGIGSGQLNHWQQQFLTIRPARGSAGQRLYSARDMAFFEGVRVLIFERGFLMSDVHQLAEEKGQEHLRGIGRASREGVEVSIENARRTF